MGSLFHILAVCVIFNSSGNISQIKVLHQPQESLVVLWHLPFCLPYVGHFHVNRLMRDQHGQPDTLMAVWPH